MSISRVVMCFRIVLTSAFSTFAVTEVKPKQQRPQIRAMSWGSILQSANCPSKKLWRQTYKIPPSWQRKNTTTTEHKRKPRLLKTLQRTFLAYPHGHSFSAQNRPLSTKPDVETQDKKTTNNLCCSLEIHVGSSVAWLSEACVDVGERERGREMDSPLGPPPDVQTSFCSWPPERQLIGLISGWWCRRSFANLMGFYNVQFLNFHYDFVYRNG